MLLNFSILNTQSILQCLNHININYIFQRLSSLKIIIESLVYINEGSVNKSYVTNLIFLNMLLKQFL